MNRHFRVFKHIIAVGSSTSPWRQRKFLSGIKPPSFRPSLLTEPRTWVVQQPHRDFGFRKKMVGIVACFFQRGAVWPELLFFTDCSLLVNPVVVQSFSSPLLCSRPFSSEVRRSKPASSSALEGKAQPPPRSFFRVSLVIGSLHHQHHLLPTPVFLPYIQYV